MSACTVYVAAPLGAPECWEENAARAIDFAQRLREIPGVAPFVPHLSLAWEARHPAEYEVWMEWCLAWVERCDVLVRLPGRSPGADREASHAEATGVSMVLRGANEDDLLGMVRLAAPIIIGARAAEEPPCPK